MIDKSFYHGQQGECFKKLDKHFEEIRHEYISQPNKVFLSPEDFSNSVRGDPQDYTDEDFFYEGDTASSCLIVIDGIVGVYLKNEDGEDDEIGESSPLMAGYDMESQI